MENFNIVPFLLFLLFALTSPFQMGIIDHSEDILIHPAELSSIQSVDNPLLRAAFEVKEGSEHLVLSKGSNPIGVERYSDQTQEGIFPQPMPLDKKRVLESYENANGMRMIIADYDGTLISFDESPARAIPTPELLAALEKLTSDEHNVVWLITGRDKEFVAKHFEGIKSLGLAPAYGASVRYPGASEWLDDGFGAPGLERITPLMEDSKNRIAGSWVEEKAHGRVWHYRKAFEIDQETSEAEASALISHLEEFIATNKLPLQVVSGSMAIEVMRNDISKGKALGAIYNMIPKHPDFVLIAGDTHADESMFIKGNEKMLKCIQDNHLEKEHKNKPQVYTVKVTHEKYGPTNARYTVNYPVDLMVVIEALSNSKTTRRHL